jgi:hypothetical protein
MPTNTRPVAPVWAAAPIAVLLALAVATLLAAPARGHEGNPNFLSEVHGLQPPVEGIRLEMLNRDDRLLLVNRSGRDVLVLGYEEEPYARIDADGTVAVNLNSPAHYLNEDRFGTQPAPEGAGADAEPDWEELSAAGRFEWHDHRAHWMGKGRPPQVRDPDQRTKVFDWTVPLEVGGEPAEITGTLHWTPLPGGGAPVGAIVAGAAVVCALLAAVFVVRRRRADAQDDESGAAGEAW